MLGQLAVNLGFWGDVVSVRCMACRPATDRPSVIHNKELGQRVCATNRFSARANRYMKEEGWSSNGQLVRRPSWT